jgi:RasGEF domain
MSGSGKKPRAKGKTEKDSGETIIRVKSSPRTRSGSGSRIVGSPKSPRKSPRGGQRGEKTASPLKVLAEAATRARDATEGVGRKGSHAGSRGIEVMRERSFYRFARYIMTRPTAGGRDSAKMLLVAYRIYCTPMELLDCWKKTFEKASSGKQKSVIASLRQFIETWLAEQKSDLSTRVLLNLVPQLVSWKAGPDFVNTVKIAALKAGSAGGGGGSPQMSFAAMALHPKGSASRSPMKTRSASQSSKSAPRRDPRRLSTGDFGEHAKRDTSLELTSLAPRQLAEVLSATDFAIFRSITCHDVIAATWTSVTPRKRSEVSRFAERFNTVAFWVAAQILDDPHHIDRQKVFEYFVSVASAMKRIKNFNGMMAVMSGLNHTSISRLKSLHAEVSADAKSTFEKLEQFTGFGSNSAEYRKAFAKLERALADSDSTSGVKKWAIPYFALYLKDLEFIRAGNNTWNGKALVNADIFGLVYDRCAALSRFQFEDLPFSDHHAEEESDNLPDFSDEQLMERSYAIEEQRNPSKIENSAPQAVDSSTDFILHGLRHAPWFVQDSIAVAEEKMIQTNCDSCLVCPSPQANAWTLITYHSLAHKTQQRYIARTDQDRCKIVGSASPDESFTTIASLVGQSSDLKGFVPFGTTALKEETAPITRNPYVFADSEERCEALLEQLSSDAEESDAFLIRLSDDNKHTLMVFDSASGALKKIPIETADDGGYRMAANDDDSESFYWYESLEQLAATNSEVPEPLVYPERSVSNLERTPLDREELLSFLEEQGPADSQLDVDDDDDVFEIVDSDEWKSSESSSESS